MLNRHAFPPALGLAVCGLVLALWACTPAKPVAPAAALNGAALEPPVALPALTFSRVDGKQFQTSDTHDRLSLFFFGYTHCSDVCPLTLAQMTQMRQTLGPAADQVDMYFVTLDPARDTPERMRAYVSNFPGVTGLVGSDQELAQAQITFNVVAQRRDLGNGDYMLDHTAATYLVNRQGDIMLAYPYATAPNDIVADLRQLTPQR